MSIEFDCDKIAIEKIKHFVSKDAFNDLEKIVENFWSLKLIKLLRISLNLITKIENLDGWGKQSVANLKCTIDLKKTITFGVIFALGIRHIGLENAKLIAKNLKTLKNFMLL